MVGMRRRELLGLLGGAVAAWPSVARAQQPIIPLFGVIQVFSREAGRTFRAAANHQISTSLTKAGDFRGPALPSPSWWRFSPPWFRSWPSAFAAGPRWNLSLLPFNISWSSCAGSGPVGRSFHLSTGCCGCGFIGFGRKSSMRWCWSSRQPWSNGIARASASSGVGDHAGRDDPQSAQKSVL
jgi:hypothetical protein